VALVACDDDPSAPDLSPLVLTPDPSATITRQGSIRVGFEGEIDPNSALEPQNFVVINTCTGLRVPGAVTLDEANNQIVFTPTSPLPFLTPLSVRVQNITDLEGRQLEQPLTFVVTTEAPDVTDLSWERMNSPTGDPVSGIDFVSRDLGYAITVAGGVYRTDDGGTSFTALFKDPNLSLSKGIRAMDADTVFMITAPNFGGTTFNTYGLYRSTDSARTFAEIFTRTPADMRTLSREAVGGRHVLFMVGNFGSTLATWRYDATTGEIVEFNAGQPGTIIGNGGDISPDTTRAIAVGARVITTNPLVVQGVAYRSVNSGRSFVEDDVEINQQLNGAGFVDNNTVLLLGDSSTVLRMDINTGAVTVLGGAQGVPQTTIDPVTLVVETFSFTRAEFAPNNRQIGWVIGELLRRDPRPNVPEVRRGVILMTRDGGQTFTRQGVLGEPDLGLGFPTLYPPSDVSALANDFAVLGGYEGFMAARRSDAGTPTAACSFETP
jgi:photosystem II stability/assembly factor-like uncharacterized protein